MGDISKIRNYSNWFNLNCAWIIIEWSITKQYLIVSIRSQELSLNGLLQNSILLCQSDLKNYHWMVYYKTISYCINQISRIIIEWSITKQYLIVSIRSQELSLNGLLQNILLYQSDLKNYHWMVNYKTISYCINQISRIIIEWSITKQYLIVSIRSQELSLNGQLQNNILLCQSDLKNYHWMVYYKTISYCINQISRIIIEWSITKQYLIVSIRSQELSLNGLLQNNILLYQSDLKNYHWMVYHKTISYCINQISRIIIEWSITKQYLIVSIRSQELSLNGQLQNNILLCQSDLKNYHWMVNYKTISYCVNQISRIIIEWSITKQYLIVSIRSQELSLNGLLQNNILLYQSDLKNYHWMVYYKTISYCINQISRIIIEWSITKQYLIVSIRSQELSLNGLLQNNILLYQSDLKNYHWMVNYKTISYCINQISRIIIEWSITKQYLIVSIRSQ